MRATDPAAGQDASAAVQAVLFELDGIRWALPLATVRGVGPSGAVRAVPKAPPFVLGLGAWHGEVLTVLDLPALLDTRADAGQPGCLVLLARPLERTAFHVPTTVRLGWVAGDPRTPGAEPLDSLQPASLGAIDRSVETRFIDAAALIRERISATGA
jgi:chemotaxis signal transduction protein